MGSRRTIVPHSGDTPRFPPAAARRRAAGLVGRRRPRLGLIGAAVVVALLPLALAVFAFGHAFRSSETSRVDSRLAGATQVAVERIAAADADAVARARELAGSRRIQVALVRGDDAALAQAAVRTRSLSLTITGAGSPWPAPAPSRIAHVISVTNAGAVIGQVVAVVSLAPLVSAVAGATGAELALAGGGRPLTGPLRGSELRPPPGRGATVTVHGRRYRVAAATLGASFEVVGWVPQSTIDSAVRKRQLSIGGAGLLTVAAIALFVLLIAPRTRNGAQKRAGVRSPMAVLGEAVAAASDPRALLPVLLETVVGAVDGSGGHVIWDGERIAETGSLPPGATPLVLSLDPVDDVRDRVIVLTPRRGTFSREEREIAQSLVSEGRIALENARLHNIVRRQAVTDELTDLANRRRFMEVIHQEVARATRFGLQLSLVLFDLDRFKQINDRYGHQAGDDVLRATAEVIRRRVRETDVPARIGGEEFAIVLSGTDIHGAAAVAESLRTDLSDVVHVGGWSVTASFGVSEFVPGSSAEALIGAADRALYRSKADGRNRVTSGGADAASPH